MTLLSQALSLITRPEGSAIYHILTLFALEAAFGIALGHRWRNGPSSNAARLAIAAGLAGAARAVLFLLGPLGDNGLIPAAGLLAPLDRAIAVVTLLLLSWACLNRSGKRWADLLLGLGLVAAIITYIPLAVLWYPTGSQGAFFNLTTYDFTFELIKLGLVLISLFALLIIRPVDWGIGLGMFFILLLGIGYHLGFATEADNFAAAERIAEMAAFPLFAVLAYRHALGSPPAPAPTATGLTLSPSQPSKVKLTPQAASALAYIAVGSDENDFAKRVSEAVGRTLLADYTLLFAGSATPDTLNCASVFDLIREQHLPGFAVPAAKVYSIASALSRGRPARLRFDTHQPELSTLAQSIGITQFGSAIFVPFSDAEETNAIENLGGLLILSAFSQKEWSNDDHSLLASIAKPLAKAIYNFNTKSTNTYELLNDLDIAIKRAEFAENELRGARSRGDHLFAQLDQSQEEMRRLQQKVDSLTAIIQAEVAVTAASALAPGEAAAPEPESESLFSDEEFEALQANYRRSLEELGTLNEELAQTQDELERLKRDSLDKDHAATDTVATLNTQLAAKQATLEQLRQESNNVMVEFTEQINSLKAELAAAQAGAAGQPVTDSEAFTRLQAERDRLEQQFLRVSSELQYAKDILADLPTTDELVQAHTENHKLKAEVARLEAILIHHSATQPLGPLPASSPDLDKINNELAAARAEIVSLRAQLQSAPADAPSILRSHSEMLLSLIQDLRQPLSSLMGYSDLLLGESVGIISALQRSFLERVKASAERMTNTIDDLVQVTAIDSGTLTLKEQNFDITDVIEDAFTSVGAQFREKSISLRMDIADEIAPIAADRDAILQIISRLLNNACAASEPNSEVTLTARPQSDTTMLLTVRDTGGGIAEKDVPRVFARFYRADRPLIQGLGDTGAGLSVAKALAEAQGGRIWVDSQVGTGSTFSVVLPTNGHH